MIEDKLIIRKINPTNPTVHQQKKPSNILIKLEQTDFPPKKKKRKERKRRLLKTKRQFMELYRTKHSHPPTDL